MAKMFENFKHRSKQLGFTLTELTVTTGAIAAATVAGASAFKAWDETNLANGLGDGLLPAYYAVQNYATKNWSELQKASPSIAGFANPMAPTIAELKAGNYFTTPFVQGGNSIGANTLIAIARAPVGCAPVNCDITFTAYYDRPLLDATGAADIRTIAKAASHLGGIGGYSTLGANALFSNPDGAWTVSNPTAQSGVLAAYSTLNTSGNAAYVKVGDNRDPNLQGTLTTAGAIKTSGNLTASGNATVNGQVYASGWLRSQTPSTGWYSDAHGVGIYAADSSWVRSYGDKGIYTGGQMQAGSLQSNGNVNVAGTVTATGTIVSYSPQYSANNSWAVLGYDGGWGANGSPQSAVGSAYLNDAYFRSIGKWASQLGSGGGPAINSGTTGSYCQSGVACVGGGNIFAVCYYNYPNGPGNRAVGSTPGRIVWLGNVYYLPYDGGYQCNLGVTITG